MTRISVVIPTLGRSPALGRVVAGLRRSADDAEVLVVADPSGDGVSGVEGGGVRVLRAARPGASAARNEGLRDAAAPLVLFLGDDVIPSRRLVAEHLAWHRRHADETAAVLGRVRWPRWPPPTAFMRWLEQGIQFDYPAIEGIEAGWGRFYTVNVSAKRALLERAGGFDESIPFLYEDLDLGRRLDHLGMRLLYNRNASGVHVHRVTVEGYRERMAVGARSERAFLARHPDQHPYFHDRFADAARRPPARGRGARLAAVVPRRLPGLGPKVWGAADLRFRQLLAPAFLEAWEAAGREEAAAR